MCHLHTASYYYIITGWLLISHSAAAITDSTHTPPSLSPTASYLTQLIGGLVIIILMILLLAWFLRRIPGLTTTGSSVIEILAVRAISSREQLLLVQIGEEQILIGLTPAGLSHLHTLRTPLIIPISAQSSGQFEQLLKQFRSVGSKP